MRIIHPNGRRDFMKLSSGGLAGLSLANFDKVFAAVPWPNKKNINPDIDNMKVVCCHDATMLKAGVAMTNFTAQNNAVVADKVYANLDEMARRLVSKPGLPVPTADEAWKKIFRSSKTWANTKVAIKVNCVCLANMPRIAIVAKLSKILTGYGVPGKNIIIYDDAGGISQYTSYCSLTDTTKVNAAVSSGNSLLGGKTSATIDGWTANAFTCTTDLINGNIDILINIALNKGHDRPHNGYFTACMKNHYGTFTPAMYLHGSTVPFISINKHDAILGGNPVRQQLCIIDSLLGSIDHNPASPPDVAPPCRLIMGTFAPAVDYLCAKKVREPVMKAVHDQTLVNSLLSYFGYTDADTQWSEYVPSNVGVQSPLPHNVNPHTIEVRLLNSHGASTSVMFDLPANVSEPTEISVFTMAGKQIRALPGWASHSRGNTIVWDGKDLAGKRVSAGTYVLKAKAGGWKETASIVVR